MTEPKFTLGIVGARGYTGAELIRLLAAHPHIELASELYRRHLPKGFVPEPSAAITKRYIIAHRMLGFRTAVQLGKLLKG